MAFGTVKGTFSNSATSITNPFVASTLISGSATVAVGDLIYAVINQQTALTVTACADNLGNTYTATNAGVDSGTSTGRAYYSRVTVAGTLTGPSFTTTASANNVTACAVIFEGPFVVPPIDANPANVSDIASPFTGPASGTLAQADELIVSWGAAAGSAVWTATSPNVKQVELASAALVKSVIGSWVVAATTTVSPAWTGTNPADDTLGTTSFKAAATQNLTPSLLSDSDTLFAPTVSPGAVDLAPSLLSDADTLFAPTLTPGAVDLAPSLHTDGDTLFAPTVENQAGSQDLAPSLHTDSDTLFAPSLSSTFDLAPSLLSDSDTIFAPTLTPGVFDLAPSLLSDSDTLFAPTVSPGAVDLAPSLIANDDALFAPTLTPGAVDLAPAHLSDSDTLFAPTLTPGVVDLAPGLHTDADTIFAPTLTPGAVDLAPSLHTDADTLFAPNVQAEGGTQDLVPSLLSDSDTIFAPTVSPGAVNLAPGLYNDADTIFTPALTPGAFDLAPSLLSDSDVLFAPAFGDDSPTFLPSPAIAAQQTIRRAGGFLGREPSTTREPATERDVIIGPGQLDSRRLRRGLRTVFLRQSRPARSGFIGRRRS